jgi:alkylation response protein AidB-like acyl-CoA dehydrogenase
MTHPALTSLSEEETMFRDTVLAYARDRVASHVAHMDEKGALDPAILPGLFELGLMGIEIPDSHGGAGGSFFDAILAVEALATVDPSVAVLVDVQNTLVLNALLRWSNEEQKTRFLPQMSRSWVGSYALSEESSGSDAFALRTRAERKEGGWVLNGRKLWITNAAESSLFIVFATVDASQGYKGITAFLVEKGFAGFSLGKKENKLGIRASSTCELVLEDCFIPTQNVLGEVGKGYKIAIETLNEGRIGIGAQMVGLAQGAFDHAMRYIVDRKQFGQSIASFQGVQFQYARAATEIEAARLMVYNAARLKDAGKPFAREAAMAKLFSSEVAERTASLAIELMGGVGFTKEYPVEKLYRDAKIGKIYEGTSNMQLSTIAKMIQADFGAKLAGASSLGAGRLCRLTVGYRRHQPARPPGSESRQDPRHPVGLVRGEISSREEARRAAGGAGVRIATGRSRGPPERGGGGRGARPRRASARSGRPRRRTSAGGGGARRRPRRRPARGPAARQQGAGWRGEGRRAARSAGASSGRDRRWRPRRDLRIRRSDASCAARSGRAPGGPRGRRRCGR